MQDGCDRCPKFMEQGTKLLVTQFKCERRVEKTTDRGSRKRDWGTRPGRGFHDTAQVGCPFECQHEREGSFFLPVPVCGVRPCAADVHRYFPFGFTVLMSETSPAGLFDDALWFCLRVRGAMEEGEGAEGTT